METAPLRMAEEEDKSKENPLTPLDLAGANNAAPKEEPPFFFLLFLLLLFVETGKANGGASNTKNLLVLSLDLASIPLWAFSILL